MGLCLRWFKIPVVQRAGISLNNIRIFTHSAVDHSKQSAKYVHLLVFIHVRHSVIYVRLFMTIYAYAKKYDCL